VTVPSARRALFLAAAVAVLASGCAERVNPAVTKPAPQLPPAEVDPKPGPDSGLVPGPHDSLVADAEAGRIPAFRHPGAKEPFTIFRNPDQYGARPSFLIERTRDGWVEAYLPMRPNGSTGWLRERDVSLRLNPYRIEIDLGRNILTVFETGRQMMRETVAVGTGGTPTPTGLFYTTILVQYPDPDGAYGPFAYGLSAFSEVLFSFGGGNGQVAIHGTNAPTFLGQDVSHGCIRMRNPAIRRLSRFLPLGTPVQIKP
jgi:lipoprotein-anchoring transpeptidase ErfK/SrfK